MKKADRGRQCGTGGGGRGRETYQVTGLPRRLGSGLLLLGGLGQRGDGAAEAITEDDKRTF